VTWTRRDSPTNQPLSRIVYGNGIFAASGRLNNTFLTSPDAVNWTIRNFPQGGLWGLAFGRGLFVAVGDNGSGPFILTSPDAVHWGASLSLPPGTNSFQSIIFDAGKFVVVGGYEVQDLTGTRSGSYILTSPDATTWTPQTSGDTNNLLSVAYGSNQFVAVSANGYLGQGPTFSETSPDAVHWTSHLAFSDKALQRVSYAAGQFIAFENPQYLSGEPPTQGIIATSPDGISWTLRPSVTTNTINAIAYGNNTVVAVGDSDLILQSGRFPSAAPVLGPVLLLPSGDIQVSLTGQSGATYTVQESANLRDWTTYTNVSLATPYGGFTAPTSSPPATRFFRALAY
jgi:hypothetical protein